MKFRAVPVLVNVLAAVGFIQAVITFTPIDEYWIRWLTGRWDAPSGDVLVILGGDSPHADGQIGPLSYWRAVYAVRAWRQGQFRSVVVTGRGPARSIAEYMVFQGVPRSMITVENNSTTTYENALYALLLIHDPSLRIAVLSSEVHMRRAERCFRKLGVRPVCIPAPDLAKQDNNRPRRWTVFLELCVETAKLAGYVVLQQA